MPGSTLLLLDHESWVDVAVALLLAVMLRFECLLVLGLVMLRGGTV
jgi:hypothetical protein